MEHFKQCPSCRQLWLTREAFLGDGEIELVGYQANFGKLVLGLLLFNHGTCQSTLAVPAERFTDLHDGPVFEERRTGRDDCPGYCLRRNELEICAAKCECAWVRRVLQIIRTWPRERAA
jgi:hypothetical protein